MELLDCYSTFLFISYISWIIYLVYILVHLYDLIVFDIIIDATLKLEFLSVSLYLQPSTSTLTRLFLRQIVNEHARFANRPTNFAVAKTDLIKKRDICKQTGDDEELNRLNEQIAELDSVSTRLDKRRTSTISSILYINERNRKINVIKVSHFTVAFGGVGICYYCCFEFDGMTF